MNQTSYKLSLLRIITNSTASVVSIILLILFFPPLAKNFLSEDYVFVLVSSIAIELCLLAFLVVHNYKEYKYSYFYLDDEKIVYHSFFKYKNIDTIYYKDVESVDIRSLNVVIIDKKKNKLILEYVSNPKKIKEEILQKVKKL